MNESQPFPWLVIFLGIALGILGDALLRAGPWGLNYAVWMWGLLISSALLTRISALHSGLAIPILFFAGCLVWRDSPFLSFWNVVVSCGLCALPVIQHAGRSLKTTWISDYARAAMLTGRSVALGAVSLLARARPWEQVPARSMRVTTRALIGVAFAAPLLLIFGGLFSSADPAFEHALTSLLRIDLEEGLGHIAGTTVIATATIGYLQTFLSAPTSGTFESRTPSSAPRFGILEIAIPIGALITLFAAFLIFQIPYLFGGASFVAREGGMTYAEYARRGFFELTAASGLVLPLLLGAHWMVDPRTQSNVRIFRALAATQIALVGVLMGSALHRMTVYVSVFGLSTDRIYATAFMTWIGVLLGWFVLTVLRGERRRFSFGAVVSGLVVLAALNFLNPDNVVARTQFARAQTGATIDPSYLASLSADAAPLVVNRFDLMPAESQCETSRKLADRWANGTQPDWRTWNLARFKARRAYASSSARFALATCVSDDFPRR